MAPGIVVVGAEEADECFRCARDIPEEWLAKQVCVLGEVQGVGVALEREGGLQARLTVKHLPLLGRGVRGEEALDVVVRGVRLDSALARQARLVLEQEVVGRRVKVQLLDRGHEEVGARVLMKSWGLWRTCVGQELVSRGLGRVDMRNPCLLQGYTDKLQGAEQEARRRCRGLWQDQEKEKRGWLAKTWAKCSEIFRSKY